MGDLIMTRLLLSLLICASLYGFQDSPKQEPQKKDTSAPDQTKAPPGDKTGHLTGHLYDQTGKPLGDVRVTLISKSPDTHVEVISSADKGAYDSGEIPQGSYEVRFEKSGYATEVIPALPLTAAMQQRDATLCRGCVNGQPCGLASGGWAAALLVAAFVLSILGWRWHNIMCPNRALLLSRAADVKRRLDAAGVMDERVKQIENRFQGARHSSGEFWDFFFWSRGEENAAFSTLHYIEVDLIDELPEERINSRLATMLSVLSQSEDGVAKDFAKRIDRALDQRGDSSLSFRRALLVEAQYYQYTSSDTYYATMTGWQNKSIWLTVVGLCLIGVLSAVVGRNVLFVAGAAGGFLSRLMQQLKRAKVPSDYGASWSTLFLSPVVGALAGWFGVLMISAGTSTGLLGSPLKFVDFDEPCLVGTMVGAFLMGFSERLFDGIIKKFEDQIDSREQAAKRPGESPAGQSLPPGPDLSLSPRSGAAGTRVKVALRNPKADQVDGIELISPKGDSLTGANFERSPDSVTFSVPANAVVGKYRVSLVMQGQKRETSEQFEVTASAGSGSIAPPPGPVAPSGGAAPGARLRN
jgi:hypothetical protein